ncbi:MAG TPA: serine protease [Verrucomicrobiae bacterium]|nr:serine protease [Verrucomicrobiae bacterium]
MDAAEARGRDLAVQGAPTSTNAPMAMSGLAMAMSGLAMAIAPDGYFLTAAHLTTNGPIQLFFWTSQGPQAARARVVASRLSRKPWMDVAVIHVDAKLPAVFEWCDARELAAGRPLIEVGASSKVIAGECLRFRRACLAGKVKAVSASAKGISLIKSDLTSRAGDSGGPVVTPSGKLAGVHSGVSSSLFGAAGVSIRPAPGWVADVIAADRLVSPPDAPPVLARHIDESWAWMLISF